MTADDDQHPTPNSDGRRRTTPHTIQWQQATPIGRSKPWICPMVCACMWVCACLFVYVGVTFGSFCCLSAILCPSACLLKFRKSLSLRASMVWMRERERRTKSYLNLSSVRPRASSFSQNEESNARFKQKAKKLRSTNAIGINSHGRRRSKRYFH